MNIDKILTDLKRSVILGFERYFDFKGRSSRAEYWYWVLFIVLASIPLSIADYIIFGDPDAGLLDPLFSLATLIPGIALGIRRLHDIDRSGWWTLIVFTIIGIPVLIYWSVQPGDEGENTYGSNPLNTFRS